MVGGLVSVWMVGCWVVGQVGESEDEFVAGYSSG